MSLSRACGRRVSLLKHGVLYSSESPESIPEFFKGRSILVTGCTGFLGQGLVEKLLRSCPDIGTIYVSIRPNRHEDTQQRFQHLLQEKVFDRVRQAIPDFGNRIVPFNGDLMLDDLGLKGDLYEQMIDNVSVIVHSAAFIHLAPPLRVSVEANVLASRNVFRFGKKCRNLCAYVHVSTSFSNGHLEHVEERVYQQFKSPDELIDIVQNNSDEYLMKNKKSLMGPIPSEYVYCKTVSENVVTQEESKAPTAVFRPCFITPALHEPYPVWTFGNGGYCGILQQASYGVIRHMAGNAETPVELLPVDMVVNSLIGVMWYLGTGQHSPKSPLVVNVHSSTDNPITVRQLVHAVNQTFAKEDGNSLKQLVLVQSRLKYNIIFATQYILPALYRDILARLRGDKAVNLINQLRLRKGMKYISYSTYRNSTKDFNNAKMVQNLLNPADKEEFLFDVKAVQWDMYISTWMKSLRHSRETSVMRSKDLSLKRVHKKK